MPKHPISGASWMLPLERIEYRHSGVLKVFFVAGDDSQIVDQCGRRDLFIEDMLVIGHSQAPPDLCDVFVQIQAAGASSAMLEAWKEVSGSSVSYTSTGIQEQRVQ